jgi:anti-anti-sigma factor
MTTAFAQQSAVFHPPTPERRQTGRFRCSLDIDCQVRNDPADSEAWPARVRNLSPLGVCLVLDRRIDPRSVVHLHLAHRWRQFECHVRLRVVYTIQRCDGSYLVGGVFARPLSPEENEGLLPDPSQGLKTEQVGDAIIAKFPAYSRLDDEVIQAVDEQLAALAAQWGDRPFILDFGRIGGLNSSMLGHLVTFNQRVTRAGGRLALCAVTPEVGDLLDKINLTTLFRIYPTEQDALRAV